MWRALRRDDTGEQEQRKRKAGKMGSKSFMKLTHRGNGKKNVEKKTKEGLWVGGRVFLGEASRR